MATTRGPGRRADRREAISELSEQAGRGARPVREPMADARSSAARPPGGCPLSNPSELTSRDTARLSGISQTTVSRVLRGLSNVTEATRVRVHWVLDETGYVPNGKDGNPSQEFRTLVMQVLLEQGALAPSFELSAAHDADAVAHTIDGMTALTVAYWLALEQGIGGVLHGRPVRPAIRPWR
jgi:hypothetical protein